MEEPSPIAPAPAPGVEESAEFTPTDDGLPPPLGEIALMTSRRRPSGMTRPSGRRREDGSSPARRSRPRPAPGEVVIGTFVGVSPLGEPLVDHPLNPGGEPVPARSTIPLPQGDLGRQVAVAFEAGDVRRPIVIGALCRPIAIPQPATPSPPERECPPIEVERDGERLVFSAEHEIVFKCGEASITLTRAGKILLRGTYLLSRSSGVNRIKGGSVQLN